MNRIVHAVMAVMLTACGPSATEEWRDDAMRRCSPGNPAACNEVLEAQGYLNGENAAKTAAGAALVGVAIDTAVAAQRYRAMQRRLP